MPSAIILGGADRRFRLSNSHRTRLKITGYLERVTIRSRQGFQLSACPSHCVEAPQCGLKNANALLFKSPRLRLPTCRTIFAIRRV